MTEFISLIGAFPVTAEEMVFFSARAFKTRLLFEKLKSFRLLIQGVFLMFLFF